MKKPNWAARPPFKFIQKNSVEKAWKEFFLEAFTVIDREIKDKTIRNWIFNKIKHKLSADRSGWEVKKALKKIIGDSKYRYRTNFKDSRLTPRVFCFVST